MSPNPRPHPTSSRDHAALQHPSMSNQSSDAVPARRPTWRSRRRLAWLGAGDHGSATLLNAHREGVAPPAA